MGRAPCCDKDNVKRGPWSPEEDATLKNYVEIHGTGGNWIALPRKAGLKRCGKSCRLRWLNYLRPDIKHGGFTEEEDNVIFALYSQMGSRWSIIASHLPGRTDNDVKNYWNTKLKKKLLAGNGNNSSNFKGSEHNLQPKMESYDHGFMALPPAFSDAGYGGIENSEFIDYHYRPELPAAGDVSKFDVSLNSSHIGSSNIDGGIMDSGFGFGLGFGFNYEIVNGIWFQEKGNEGNSSSYPNLADFSYGVINQY